MFSTTDCKTCIHEKICSKKEEFMEAQRQIRSRSIGPGVYPADSKDIKVSVYCVHNIKDVLRPKET